jgi:GntR family transcriptional regulator
MSNLSTPEGQPVGTCTHPTARAKLIGPVSAPFGDSSAGAAARGRLRRASPVPLYFQLAEILKERIEAGRWPAGGRFPSERELSDEFAISRTVIRPALELLQSDGQLVRIKGRGTFVTPPKVAWRIRGLARLMSGAREPDVDVRILSASEQRAEPDVREVLELEPDVTVVQATVVVLSGGSPVYMSNSFIASSRMPNLSAVLAAGPGEAAARTAADGGPELVSASATVATAFVSQWEATQLELSAGDPCFLIRYVERIRQGDRARPVEFARIVFRSDVELDVELA